MAEWEDREKRSKSAILGEIDMALVKLVGRLANQHLLRELEQIRLENREVAFNLSVFVLPVAPSKKEHSKDRSDAREMISIMLRDMFPAELVKPALDVIDEYADTCAKEALRTVAP